MRGEEATRMAVEQTGCQEPGNDGLSRPGSDSEVMDNDKEGIVLSREPSTRIEQEAEQPYSIYTLSEKWFIVSMASLAALFR